MPSMAPIKELSRICQERFSIDLNGKVHIVRMPMSECYFLWRQSANETHSAPHEKTHAEFNLIFSFHLFFEE